MWSAEEKAPKIQEEADRVLRILSNQMRNHYERFGLPEVEKDLLKFEYRFLVSAMNKKLICFSTSHHPVYFSCLWSTWTFQ